MAEKKELYTDGIGQIHFVGGMVRFDFMSLQPAKEGEAPVPEGGVRIIMPPQGFLGAFNSMQQLIDRMLAAGILQKTGAAPAEAPAPKSAPAKKGGSAKSKKKSK